MADDDEDKGRKTNADRDFKPSQEARKGYAPRGAEGRPAASMPTPGLGTHAARQVAGRSTEQSPDNEPRIVFRENQAADKTDDTGFPALDPNKGITIKTDIPQYDKELAKDHNVITREHAEHLLGKETVARTFYDEPGASAEKATVPETTADADKQKAQELFDQMKKQKDHDKGHGR
jgi:hypothetical protein